MGLTHQIFKHTAIYSFATVLGRLISFIMLPFYAHIFNTEGYGIIGMVDASLGLLSVLFAAGFHVAILKIYHEENHNTKKLVISTAIRLIWCLGVVSIILPAIFCSQLSSFFLGSKNYSMIILLALITFVIEVAGQSASTFLIIEQKSILYSLVGILRLLLGVSLNIWLVIILKVGVIGVFITSSVISAISSLIFHYAAIRAHGFGYNGSVAKKLIKFQAPLMPGELVSYATRQAERFIVNFIINIKAVGVLEMAYKFPPLMNLFVTFPFMRAWRSKAFEIAGNDDAPFIIGKMFTKFFFLIICIGMLIALGIDDILKITTPPEFWGAARITKIEVVTTILAGANSYVIFGMLYMDKTKEISIIKSLIAIFKISLGFVLVSSFKLYGAAFSALITETIMLAVIFYKSQLYYKVNYEYAKLFSLLFYCSLIFIIIDSNIIDNLLFINAVKCNSKDIIMKLLPCITNSLFSSNKIISLIAERYDHFVSLVFNMLEGFIFLSLIPFVFWKGKRIPHIGRSCSLSDSLGE